MYGFKHVLLHDIMSKPITIMATGGAGATAATREVLTGINAVVVARNWLLHVVPAGEYFVPSMLDFDPDLVFLLFDDGAELLPHLPKTRKMVGAAADLAIFGIPSVNVDNRAAGAQAAEHLLEHGFRWLAAFGFWQNAWARDRLAGFQVARGASAVEVAGWPKDAERWREDWYSPQRLRDWVTALPKPTGVFIPCDAWVQMFANQCRMAGVRIPEDIAIISVDNDAVTCELNNPPLSSVIVPWQRIGYEAALLGESLLSGAPRASECTPIAPMGVFARRSSDTLAVDDPDVAATLAIIHAHADRPLTVSRILSQVPVSQHRLERKFRALIGRRINQEIRRIHVERAKQLLTTTDLSMPEIARQSGFANASKLAIAFRAEVGRTPTEYRRRYRVHKEM